MLRIFLTILTTFGMNVAIESQNQSRRHREALVDLTFPNIYSSTPNWNMNSIISGVNVTCQNFKPPCANVTPPVEDSVAVVPKLGVNYPLRGDM